MLARPPRTSPSEPGRRDVRDRQQCVLGGRACRSYREEIPADTKRIETNPLVSRYVPGPGTSTSACGLYVRLPTTFTVRTTRA